jgi:hypothetical protein
MNSRAHRYLLASLLGVVVAFLLVLSSAAEQREPHKTVSGVVDKGSGALIVKTAQGATYQLTRTYLDAMDTSLLRLVMKSPR